MIKNTAKELQVKKFATLFIIITAFAKLLFSPLYPSVDYNFQLVTQLQGPDNYYYNQLYLLFQAKNKPYYNINTFFLSIKNFFSKIPCYHFFLKSYPASGFWGKPTLESHHHLFDRFTEVSLSGNSVMAQGSHTLFTLKHLPLLPFCLRQSWRVFA